MLISNSCSPFCDLLYILLLNEFWFNRISSSVCSCSTSFSFDVPSQVTLFARINLETKDQLLGLELDLCASVKDIKDSNTAKVADSTSFNMPITEPFASLRAHHHHVFCEKQIEVFAYGFLWSTRLPSQRCKDLEALKVHPTIRLPFHYSENLEIGLFGRLIVQIYYQHKHTVPSGHLAFG